MNKFNRFTETLELTTIDILLLITNNKQASKQIFEQIMKERKKENRKWIEKKGKHK